MRLKSVKDCSIGDLNSRAGAFVAACGYELRSPAVSRLVKGPELKVALCFEEWREKFARQNGIAEITIEAMYAAKEALKA